MSTVWSLSNVDVNEFLAIIDKCQGNKSKLCQLVGLQKLIEGGIISNATLVCDNIKDEEILVKYKLYKVIED